MPAFLHVFFRKAVLFPLLVVLIALLAFEGYGRYTRSGPVDYQRGGDFALVPDASPPTRLPSTPSSAPAAVPSPSAPAAAVARSAPSAAPVVTAAPGRSQAAVSPTALVLPRTGSYGLSVTGSEKVRFGPVSFCNQSLPTSTKLVVSNAAGESPTSFDFDVPYVPGKAGQHDERHIYRYTPKGVFLDYEVATVTCQGVRQSSATSFAPPQLRVALPLSVGARWSNHGGGSNRTEDATSRVTKTQTLVIAGERVLTYVIETAVSFTGSETGTRQQTWWYAPTWAMPVQWTEKQSGGRSGASYTGELTARITSHP